jgi:hypothetical protein
MRLLLLVVMVIGGLVSLLPILYPGTVVGSLGMPVNAFIAETLRSLLNLQDGALVVMGEGAAHMLTVQGVLAVFLPLLGMTFLAYRGR